jgi:hypothetical protein
MRARMLLAWIAVGLVGLALAAGVTYAATQLSSQRIGLSAEPPSAGEELAPPSTTRTVPRTTPAAPSSTSRPVPSEERGEGSRGSGRRDLDD